MMLTHDNYFSSDNKYLSNSKVSDWFKDKNFFYRKHITGELKTAVTDPMVIGSAVDEWLTGSKKQFEEQYLCLSRRSRSLDTLWRYQLAGTMYDSIVSMCENVEQSQALKTIKEEGYISQDILQADLDLTHFDGIAGITDWYKVDEENKLITIIDLKTSQTINPEKYYWKCMELGYYRQQAFYQILLDIKYGNSGYKFISKHLVIEKDPDGINKSCIFILNQEKIEEQKELLYGVFEDIKNEKDFNKTLASFDDEVEI